MGESGFRELKATLNTGAPSGRADLGVPVPAVHRLRIVSSGEWEEIAEEWASSLKSKYRRVLRYGGAGDLGCDVVGFVHDEDLHSVWDNYQCKHYNKAIGLADARPELAKIIYYSYIGEYRPPRRYYFVAPFGLTTPLTKRIRDANWLRADVLENWDDHCADSITSTKRIPLDDSLRAHIQSFDFAIFDHVTPVEIIEGHSKTPFFATRFGGGLPDRPPTPMPPAAIQSHELRYVEQLYEAYSDHMGTAVADLAGLTAQQRLVEHLHRSRQNFFSAESLRNFARDHLPESTYNDLLDDLYAGVADTCDGDHADGFERVCATTAKAAQLQLSGNPLVTHTRIRDRHGMCHQLANDDRLIWVKTK